ncbi:3-deoxy-7-phosphoheptulonate synthase [Leptolyngbya sp. FACHB-261]|uniref:3-deoxy-7-phosphoheptulonate synthase n=1 Tax=Leptolyngbya sp. FACHB-261 TaxID=2692806 RepID=UPI0016867EAB|nr:3-deoxy-7-phosphoheptulonate synthase [Leptolyngbya sp. FACHB-261]MBD2100783.1 3-deoxy-7-phosphoheptulonate synthase [Leptolyngbya sp. FACHB-261]
MIIVMEADASEQQIAEICAYVQNLGFEPHRSQGVETTIVGIIGDDRRLDANVFRALEGVGQVIPVLKPYKLASRDFQPQDSLVDIGNGVVLGGPEVAVIAGPCSVEGEQAILEAAQAVKQAGAVALRGGAYKPRTSPYGFRGLGEVGLDYLASARVATGLPVVTEVMSPAQVEYACERADVLQIGARNMQNYDLLLEVGRTRKPVMLKRGLSATMNEFLLAAEYILSQGNWQVILCERGIRTFETHTRNTLDLNTVVALKGLTHLPVVVDPSHGTGRRELVLPMARAAVACGADGIIVEAHPIPDASISDAQQAISPAMLAELVKDVKAISQVVRKMAVVA